MLQQQRLGENRSSAAGKQQLGNRRNEMDGENGQIPSTNINLLRLLFSPAPGAERTFRNR
jgi:hypothetical protein